MVEALTREPEWSEIIGQAIENRLLDVHTSTIGHVVAVDYARNTVDVRPCLSSRVPAVEGGFVPEELPVLPAVRVAFFRAGGFRLTFPIAVGDPVRLVFSEHYSGTYRATGAPGDPGLGARFDLSSAVAWPVDERDASVVDWSPSEAVIDGPGAIRLGGPSASPVALAEKVEDELDKIKTIFTALGRTYTPAGVGASKVKAE